MASEKIPLLVRLDPEQDSKVRRLARGLGKSVAWVVRDLIDRAEEK